MEQKMLFESGNELAAYAAKQINYHIMGYYPITPSTQIAEHLDLMKADGEHDVLMIPADGEHGAAGICYGASTGGGRVFNATSANGLLFALEQLPVQSGTRFPMVMNIACRTVSGPLSIKGDHSDIMYTLNTGWIILYAKDPQAVYDMNICALKIAEKVMLPVIVGFDGFFTSHQKRRVQVFAKDEDVRKFVGEYKPQYNILDVKNPISVGSYMNEPDLLNNKYQLHLAMDEAKTAISLVFDEFYKASGRRYEATQSYKTDDAEVVMLILGSAYDTACQSCDVLRQEGKQVGVFSINVLRPWFPEAVYDICKNAKVIIVCDRQDSYGAGGGNLSIELKASLQQFGSSIKVISRVYGLSGRDFYLEDGVELFNLGFKAMEQEVGRFDYFGHYLGKKEFSPTQYFKPVNSENASPGVTTTEYNEETGTVSVKGGIIKETTKIPRRLMAGHGACPGCGIPVNINLLLKGIEGNVVLLFHTGCGMVVTTCYPKTSFTVPYLHNLFQNGAATLSGLVEMYHQKQKRGEMDQGDITFIMVSGDGGFDIGMGPSIGAALRNHHMIIFEYDNSGYMNTGYQLSYSTPLGAKTSTSHVGVNQAGKINFHKDTAQIMAATNIPYVATVSESIPTDFIKKAAKAAEYAKRSGLAYLKALSACPLNWGDIPRFERQVIEAGVNCCYHPLYEIENGITHISYNPEEKNKKVPVRNWFEMMGRTKHLLGYKYGHIMDSIQTEVDRRWERLKARDASELL